MSSEKPWGGRFSKETDKFIEEFTESVSFDKNLALFDIKQNIAHCKALEKAGVLTKEESEKIIKGLKKIEKENNQQFYLPPESTPAPQKQEELYSEYGKDYFQTIEAALLKYLIKSVCFNNFKA